MNLGVVPLVSFSASLLLFVPKGDEKADLVEIFRAEMDSEPQSLKDSSNKIIGGVQIAEYRSCAQQNTHRPQRRFVPGRLFLGNVLGLDSAARFFL